MRNRCRGFLSSTGAGVVGSSLGASPGSESLGEASSAAGSGATVLVVDNRPLPMLIFGPGLRGLTLFPGAILALGLGVLIAFSSA